LNNLNLKNTTEDFIGVFLKAGKIAKEISQRGAKVSIKADKSPVTDGDLAVDKLLKDKIKKHKSNVYLVNTGWIGGSAISGAKRISIQNTRLMITSILNGSIEKSAFHIEPIFGLSYPTNLEGVSSSLLNPRLAWNDPDKYDSQADELAQLFISNFKTFGKSVLYLCNAGPQNHNEIAI